MPKLSQKILFVLIGLFIALQFLPVSRTNPAIVSDFNESATVKQIFLAACYDCHSYETKWPWYSYIAPVSWLIAHDVEEGREHLNFSQWGRLTKEEQAKLRREIWEEVEEGEMPLAIYTWIHPSARLSAEEKKIIEQWATTTKKKK